MGVITMYEKNLTVCEMLLQMIDGNHLSVAEEAAIRKALDGKAAKSEEDLFKQYALELNRAKASEPCRQGSTAGEWMQEFLILSECFDKKKTASNLRLKKDGIRFIDNPYTVTEAEAIREWVEDHPYDVRGLAIGLWLSGGITPETILNLKTAECWKDNEITCMDDTAVDRAIFQRWDRFRIVKRALDQHQGKQPYVFMVYEESRWKKLNGNAIQLKLFHICRDIGITYNGFSNNDAIMS